MYYLRLFHGRKDPAEQLDDWGTNGPYIGPFSAVTWTYGDLKLHTEDDFRELSRKQDGDMVKHDNVWYGDFELRWIDGLEEANEMKDAISFYEFFKETYAAEPCHSDERSVFSAMQGGTDGG